VDRHLRATVLLIEAVPSAIATVGLISGCYWAVMLFVRLGPERTPREAMAVHTTSPAASSPQLEPLRS
jgi:hypothetical protein